MQPTAHRSETHPLRLAPRPAPDRLRAEYARSGKLMIPNLLETGSARALHTCLAKQKEWNLVFNQQGRHVDLDAADVATWTAVQREELARQIHAQARTGFQYHYATIPIYDIFHKKMLPGHLLNEVFQFLNGVNFLDMVRDLTGDREIGFADAQATRFSAGHFLTRHDDDVSGKNRRVAYVLGLTMGWRADWGGLLQFFGPDGHVEKAYVPAFNTLTLFRVPTPHCVAMVTPFAGAHRYSITGWLRSGRDPAGSA